MCCRFRHQRSGIAKGGKVAGGRRGRGLGFARFEEFASSPAGNVHYQSRLRDFRRESTFKIGVDT